MFLQSMLLLSILLTTLPAYAAPPTRAELSLAGLKPDDPLALVRKKLGKPAETSGQPGDHDYSLIYPGLKVDMVEPGQVQFLESTSPRYCTPSGVCPGQTLATVRKRWGEVEQAEPEVLEYDVDEGAYFLRFQAEGDAQRITSISMACP